VQLLRGIYSIHKCSCGRPATYDADTRREMLVLVALYGRRYFEWKCGHNICSRWCRDSKGDRRRVLEYLKQNSIGYQLCLYRRSRSMWESQANFGTPLAEHLFYALFCSPSVADCKTHVENGQVFDYCYVCIRAGFIF
jgi:hypothetical protein